MRRSARLMKLMSSRTCWAEIFSNTPEAERPTFRTWENWRAKGAIPSVKIGGRCFCDLEQVRAVFSGKVSKVEEAA